MDIKKRIQELSLDQKAKLYFMGLVRQGKIDTLPEDPKAAYVSMMMDKDDYGRSVSGKDKRTFMEPEDSMPAARARKLAGMEDDPRMDPAIRSDFDDPMFENYTKQSLLKALGNADDALIQTHVSPGEKGEGDYRLDGQEYVIYNPNSNNDDNAAMWNSDDYVVALDKDGEEYEIAYSDIMRINLEETSSLREMATKLGYIDEEVDEQGLDIIERGLNQITGGGRQSAGVSDRGDKIRVMFRYMRGEFDGETWETILEYLSDNMGYKILDQSNYYEANYDREEPAEAVPMIHLKKNKSPIYPTNQKLRMFRTGPKNKPLK